jgi:predicted dehydrogenase
MEDRIGIAFVGCTHPHIFPRIQLLSQEKNVTLVGCYDPDSHLTSELERLHNLKAYATPEELLDERSVNYAVIEGWDPDNPRYVEMAAKRGQAVLLEKPGAPNLSEMQRIVDVVKNANVPFHIGYMLQFSSALRHCKRLMDSGVLGPVTLARFHAAAPVGGSAERWQSVPGDLGGVMYTDACHMIHLIYTLYGLPKSVQATHLKLPAGGDVIAHGFKKDTLAGLGETVEMPLGGLMYEDAGAGIFDYGDKLVTFDLTGWEAHPWVEAWTIELYGTDATLYVGIQPSRYKLYVRNPKPGFEVGWHGWRSLDSSTVGNSLVVDENYTGEAQHMLKRVRAWDTDNRQSLKEAEAVITILDAMYRSHREGERITVEMRPNV